MQKKTLVIGSATAAGVLLLGGVAAVNATGTGFAGDERDDAPLSGSTLSRAGEAAVEAAGGGKVTETERSGDHGGVYEVEVTLDNGSQVDVELDRDFTVVHKETDAADDESDRDDADD